MLLPALNCWGFPWCVFFQASSHRNGATTLKYTTIQCTTVVRKPQVSFSTAAPTPPKFTVSLCICITSRGAWGIRYPNALSLEYTKVGITGLGEIGYNRSEKHEPSELIPRVKVAAKNTQQPKITSWYKCAAISVLFLLSYASRRI